jgi:AmiR/NasT family two-component response regulator
VYLTAHGDVDTLKKVMDTNPEGYIIKPFNTSQLRSVIEIALEKFRKDQ